MSNQGNIPDAAVEAAARAMAPAVWGPRVWTFVAHGETPAAARNRVQRQSLDDARAALKAAVPHLSPAPTCESDRRNKQALYILENEWGCGRIDVYALARLLRGEPCECEN